VVTRTASRGWASTVGERHGRTRRASKAIASPNTDQLESLRVTHSFDPGETGPEYSATVRFDGRRNGSAQGSAGDRVVRDEVIPHVFPGTGPISVTAMLTGLTPGSWTVTATVLKRSDRPAKRTRASAPSGRSQTLPRAGWSWRRWSLVPARFEPVATRWGPMARLVSAPAVVPGSWTGLVLVGVMVGLVVQTALLAGVGVSSFASIGITVTALLAGLAGAKLRYIMLHPDTWRRSPGEGWAVDGFLVVMPAVAVVGLVALDVPIGPFVDASSSGLFFGIAIGRVGCFLTGCCAGRVTRSRWGIWSSDRRVGARRIPAQLLESATGLVLGIAALVAFLVIRPPVDGLIFLTGLVLYTLARRALLRLRAER
jgi:phosphatidylglycerol---prolipoprotein diacylglyceryl transferase